MEEGRCIDGWIEGWIDRWGMEGRKIDGWMDEWMDRRMDGWKECGQMDG